MTPARYTLLTILLTLAAAPSAAAAPGDPDRGFGQGGVATATRADGLWLSSLALSGERIVGVGTVTDGCLKPAVARWTRNGRLDRGFGTRGIASPSLGRCRDADDPKAAAHRVVVGADGRVFTAGIAEVGSSGRHGGLLSAYTRSGAFDRTFGDGGWTRAGFGEGLVHELLRLPDGRLVAAGFNYGLRTSFEVARFLRDGGPDRSFAGSGGLELTLGGSAHAHAAALGGEDGSIVVAGDASPIDGAQGIRLVRLRSDGSPDPAFGDGGWVRIEIPGRSASARELVRLPDDSFVVLVLSDAGGSDQRWHLLRIGPAGDVDPGFGRGGRRQVEGDPAALAVDRAGRLVLAANTTGGPRVTRYRADGTLDRSFGDRGVTSVAGLRLLADAVVQRDGGIVVGGEARRRSVKAMALVRLRG